MKERTVTVRLLTPEEKRKVVLSCDGQDIAAVAAAHGIGYSTLSAWIRTARDLGIDAVGRRRKYRRRKQGAPMPPRVSEPPTPAPQEPSGIYMHWPKQDLDHATRLLREAYMEIANLRMQLAGLKR